MKLDYSKIEKKIEDMLKDEIQAKGLVDTGKLFNSIEVRSDRNGNMKVIAEDYFIPLDEKHGISDAVFESDELAEFIGEEFARQLEEGFDKKDK